MSDVYKLTQKSVWTNNIDRHTTWYLLDEHKMGYYIDYIEWTVQRDWGSLRLDSECMAFRYDGKKGLRYQLERSRYRSRHGTARGIRDHLRAPRD